MPSVACEDIGIPRCGFVAEGERVSEVRDRMQEHLRGEHPEVVAGLTDARREELKMQIVAGMQGLAPAPEREADAHERHALLRIACARLGTTGCEFVAEDREMHRVEEKVYDHLRDRHPEMLAGLTDGDYGELEDRVEGAIERAVIPRR